MTAKEIGRQLGLSQPTVSRILAGADGYRVSAETRRRVLEAAAQMGYRPNALARSLRQRRTNVVGFYTGYGYLDARNAFLAALIGGLQHACDRYRQDLLLHGVFRGGSTDDIYGELVDGRIDGLFVHTYAEDPLVAKLQASSLPVVALADAVPGLPSVVCDDAGGVRMLVDFLWERGHRSIGYVRPERQFHSVEVRCDAFRAAMREHGALPENAPIFTVEMEQAAPLLETIRSLTAPPTALCCWNDLAAYDLIFACRQSGIAVPGTLAVAGFDGLLDPKLTGCNLVTVAASWGDITQNAVDLLMRQINATIRTEKSESESSGTPLAEEMSLLPGFPVTLVPGDTA